MTGHFHGPTKPGSVRHRIVTLLEQSPNPLYPVEIHRALGEIRAITVRDTLGSLYREGRVAKAAPFRGADALWTSLGQAHKLPQASVYKATLPAPVKPLPPEPKREPARINPRAIAYARSIFDWGNRA